MIESVASSMVSMFAWLVIESPIKSVLLFCFPIFFPSGSDFLLGALKVKANFHQKIPLQLRPNREGGSKCGF